MSIPELLLDLADQAHRCVVAGHSQAEIARAAGVPYDPPKRRARPDEIIARILHRDPATMHPDDLEWWRVVVNQTLTYSEDV